MMAGGIAQIMAVRRPRMMMAAVYITQTQQHIGAYIMQPTAPLEERVFIMLVMEAAGDPSTGSQAAAIAAINTVGTTSGVNLYDGVDGVVTGMQQNTPGISYQMTPLRDLDSPSSALKGDNM